MTRNLYLGVDLSRLVRARSVVDLRRIAGRMLEDVQRRPFPPRAEAIAAEVAATRPDVVGVQEAAVVRTQEPGDFVVGAAPNAEDGVVDFLEVLLDALAARGLEYGVAASVVTSDVEVPADVDGRVVDARLTDRDALLVRDGVEVGETRTGTYGASLEVPVDAGAVSIDRGYVAATVSVDGIDATVATTHLESADTEVRLRQARALLDLLPSDGPAVLAGDLNSGPGGSRAAFGLMADPLDDVYSRLRPGADDFTCCQAADLRNDDSWLSRRIDVVLSRDLRPTAVERVGDDPDDRVSAVVDGQPTRLWPSDHAGVVATFAATTSPGTGGETGAVTPDPDQTSSRSPGSPRVDPPSPTEPSDGRTTGPPQPGFGIVASILVVLLGALSRRLR